MAEMSSHHSGRSHLLGWAAVISLTGISAAFLSWSLLRPIAVNADPPGLAAALPDQPVPDLSGQPPEQPKNLLARPVFLPSRTIAMAAPPPPPAVAPAAEVVDTTPDPDYSIGGVIITPQIRKTLLRANGGERGQWLSEGELIQGWTISSINSDRVLFARGTRRYTIELYKPN